MMAVQIFGGWIYPGLRIIERELPIAVPSADNFGRKTKLTSRLRLSAAAWTYSCNTDGRSVSGGGT
jgi:hypothetical protein